MANVLIDPWLLAFRSSGDANEYLDRLLNIFDAFHSSCLNFQITASAAELLEQDDAFPVSRAMPAPLWPRREDVYRVVVSILEKANKVEDQAVPRVLAENCSISPELCPQISEANREYLIELMPLCVVREKLFPKSKNILLSDGASSNVDLDVAADVVAIDTNDGGLEPEIGFYSGSVRFRVSLEKVLGSVSPVDLALRGYVEEAFALALWQSDPLRYKNHMKADGWRIGHRFLESARSCGLYDNKARMASLIRSATSMISDVNLRSTHVLRVDAGPGSKQKVRSADKAGAWRADIDDELHLHYWQVGGFIEFANVVFHNDFSIY